MALNTRFQFNQVLTFNTNLLQPVVRLLVGNLAIQTVIINFVNDSNNLIAVNFDGTNTDHEVLFPNSVYTINLQSNINNNNNIFFAKNMPIYVSSATNNAGGLFISYYGIQQQ